MNSILILHGWGSCAKNWARVKELLEAKGVKVFVPDLPGFGDNPSPETPWTIDDYVNWAKNYIEKLSQARGELVEPFFLLGHSFGGGLAVKLTSLFPEKVKRLILVGAKIRRQKTIRYYFGLALGKLGKIIFFAPGISFLQPLGRKVLYKLIGTRDYYKLEVEKAITMKETFKEIVKEDLTSYLSKIKSPTLIIWGEKDNVTPIKDAYLINKKIEGSKLELIKDRGHVLNIEAPDILAEKIIQFIH